MKTTTDRANDALESLIEHCAENRGAMTLVQRLLKNKFGQDVNFRNLMRWLNPDKASRTEPLLGVGLMLIDIAFTMEIGAKKPRRKAAR